MIGQAAAAIPRFSATPQHRLASAVGGRSRHGDGHPCRPSAGVGLVRGRGARRASTQGNRNNQSSCIESSGSAVREVAWPPQLGMVLRRLSAARTRWAFCGTAGRARARARDRSCSSWARRGSASRACCGNFVSGWRELRIPGTSAPAHRISRTRPFYPITDMLQQAFAQRGDETDEAKLGELERVLELAGLNPAEAVPLVAPMLNIPVGESVSAS